MANPAFVRVSFHVIDVDTARSSWKPPFPSEDVLAAVRGFEFATGDFYMPSRLGNQVFCQVQDGPFPVVVGYTRDVWTERLSERKGEVRVHELEEDAAWVDPTYMAFFPNDVVGLVRTSRNSPGSALIAHWLSSYGPHAFYLFPLPKPDVFADLNRPADEMYGFRARVKHWLLDPIRTVRADVADAFEAAGKVGDVKSSTLGLEWQANPTERAQWWPPMKVVINDLAEAQLLMEFETAQVQVTNHAPVNLKDAYLTSKLQVSRQEKARFGLNEAATTLARGHREREPAIAAAVELWRQTAGERAFRRPPEPLQTMGQSPLL
jgi:hypothetical protein